MALFVTEYAVVGSPCTGTYLVNATSKKQANSIVRKLDDDYCRIKSLTQEETEDLFSMDWSDVIGGVEVPQPGHASHIESGT